MCANSGRATMFQIKKQKFQEFFSKLLSDPPFWKSVKKSRTKNVAGSKNFFYQSSRAFHILGGEWGFWSQKTPFWKGAKSTRLKKSSNQTRLEYKLSGIFCKLAGELCVFGRNLKKCGFYSHKTFFRFCTLEGKKAHKNEEKKILRNLQASSTLLLKWFRIILNICVSVNVYAQENTRSCGLMDKAPDFGSGDCRFESCHDRFFSPC